MIFNLAHTVLESADRLPDKVAFRCGKDSLTYSELAEQISRLAAVLREYGVQRGDLVPIFMNRSIETVVAIFGILLAGGAYVPLNPRNPRNTLFFQLKEIASSMIVTNGASSRQLIALLGSNEPGTALPTQTIIGTQHDTADLAGLKYISWSTVMDSSIPFNAPKRQIDTDLAYVIYTSGSTGNPKGIMHNHRSAIGHGQLTVQHFDLNEEDVMGNHAPIFFDISTSIYFSTPLLGASAIIASDAEILFPPSLSQLIEKERISFWYSVPLAMVQMLQKGSVEDRDWSALRRAAYAGEPMPPKYLRQLMLLFPKVRFSNLYGPTETNVCTYYDIPNPPVGNSPIPIGDVWSNTDRIILDEAGNEVNKNGTGELLISSNTTMVGYLNRPKLNEKAFYYRSSKGGINIPYYRTGDLVRLEDDQLIHFLGRKDNQLKIKGYRVELAAVENSLLAHPGINEAVVFPVETAEGTLTLEAALILKDPDNFTERELFSFLREQLPAYGIPERYHLVSDFPRTGSNKLDRNALIHQIKESKKNL